MMVGPDCFRNQKANVKVKIAFLAYGTRGDIQPFLAVGKELRTLGHHVLFGANENFSDWVVESGFDFFPIRGDFQKIFDSDEGQKWLASRDIRALISRTRDLGSKLRHSIQEDCFNVCKDADVIVATALTFRFGLTISEKLGIPMVIALTFPIFPETDSFIHPLMAVVPSNLQFKVLNRFTHKIFNKLSWTKRDVKGTHEWRSELGLPSLNGNILDHIYERRIPILHLVSERLLPRPSDWASENIFVGTPVLIRVASDSEQKESLKKWIEVGNPPVYLGFGSMPVLDPDRIIEMIREISIQTGLRFVLCAGWTEIKAELDSITYKESDSVVFVSEVDHEWLFPKCSVIVHHGGIGTTVAAVRSGRPSAVFSVFMDQPFWGMILAKQGLGVHYKFQNLNASILKQAIKDAKALGVNDQNSISKSLRKENSAKNAATVILNFGKPA